ncbi:hypothetical protein F5050DRAFT_1811860 [Lentinula boryana]|uniref:Velvet domain-containing protein n=1 Tax=Lentinula boryana TaxID=40481 RepID=A0ABQ8Q0Q5_9AGAR|nr:hypothetical protein F5050DRAFT_1811860 [Lentinula boryana]
MDCPAGMKVASLLYVVQGAAYSLPSCTAALNFTSRSMGKAEMVEVVDQEAPYYLSMTARVPAIGITFVPLAFGQRHSFYLALDFYSAFDFTDPPLCTIITFAPYSESISALGGQRRTNVFGPTTATALPTMEVTQELAIGGNTKTLHYEIQALYTANGMLVQVRTPRMVTRIAMASSSRVPPSPTATTLFRQLLSRSGLEQIQIPQGQEDEEQAKGDHQDGEDNPADTEEPIDPKGLEGGDGPGGPGGGGPGGPGGLL